MGPDKKRRHGFWFDMQYMCLVLYCKDEQGNMFRNGCKEAELARELNILVC